MNIKATKTIIKINFGNKPKPIYNKNRVVIKNRDIATITA